MVFSSPLFLYAFLPLCIGIYFLSPSIKYRNAVLLIASLFFYAWGEPRWIILMIFSSLCNYLCGLGIAKTTTRRGRRGFLWLGVGVSLALLVVFKYTGFFVDNLNLLPFFNVPGWKLSLPIGISFFTFQALTYLVDVYRGQAQVQRSFGTFLLYISMFPQLIAGPIVRYSDVAEQLKSRMTTVSGFSGGILRFSCGLGKKVLLANFAGAAVKQLMAGGLSSMTVLDGWLMILLYAFQIYFDFSGYSDMAIGLGRIFGLRFLENFNYPYVATSITDFWRRWHISLSTFFRDYVYIPMGGNRRHQMLNILVVWMLTGFWHGASWNFLLWGLYYAVFLILEKTVLHKLLERLPAAVGRIYSFLLVLLGWVFFYFTDTGDIFRFFGVLFGQTANGFTNAMSNTLLWQNLVLLVLCVLGATPLCKGICAAYRNASHGSAALQIGWGSLAVVYSAAMLALSTICVVAGSFNPFLYFRF